MAKSYARSFAWETESARLTAIAPPSGEVRFRTLKALTGKEPEQTLNPPAPQPSMEMGSFHNGRLIVSRQMGRADLAMVGLLPDDATAIGSLGAPDKAISALRPLARKVWPQGSIVNRLAVGLVLISPQESLAQASLDLAQSIPLIKDCPEDITDFGLQLNRPVTSKNIPNLTINRLIKWNASFLQRWTVTAGQVAPAPVTAAPISSRAVIRMELDINTMDAPAKPLPAGKLATISKELIDLAEAIVERGYFP
jgi:hypothetical protein